MIRKYAERYRRWQQTVPLVSPFVVACGVIAVVYFFYRIVLVVSPAVIIERAVLSPAGSENAVCQDSESNHRKDPRPLLSASYQKRIQDQRELKPNAVDNPNLSKTDLQTSQPTGYSHTVENDNTKYEILKDDDKRFLRVVTKKAPKKDAPSPAWQIEPVTIQKDKTYAYSFWYRSSVPIEVSLEYMADDKTQYNQVTTLDASRSWQQFTAHFANNSEATSFRVNLSMDSAGWLDTRAFDIHRIPDARLKTGMVSVTFDDGWQSVGDKALRLLEKYDIRSTQYIISDAATQQVPGYMDFATLEKFKKSGHEIGSHTPGHCDQTTLSQEGLEQNATKSKHTLEQQNLGPVTSFAYPEGRYNRQTQKAYEKHYPLIRTSDFGYNDRYFDETNIRSISVNSDTTEKELESWLKYAKTHRLWVVFVYHRVDAKGKYSVTSAQLERHLQMIAESDLKTLLLSKAAKAIRE